MSEKIKMLRSWVEPKEHFSLYLFGSSVYSDDPQDIDIAVVYDKTHVNIEQAVKYRAYLRDEFKKRTDLAVDIVLLSKEEEQETEFLANAKHVVLFKLVE